MAVKSKKLIVITGPTASGKTDISIQTALKFDTEIISCDSRQFYKEIPIGTAAPDKEQLSLVKHHFIGNKSIHDNYSASLYENDALNLINELFKSHDILIMTGGSGLYMDAVCAGFDQMPDVNSDIRQELRLQLQEHGIEFLWEKLEKIDPDYFELVDKNNSQRILRALEICLSTNSTYSEYRKGIKKERSFQIVKFCMDIPRDILYDRINKRVDKMFREGLVKEAEEVFPFRRLNSLHTVGFRELFAYFDGKTELNSAKELIKRNTRRYAKRQLTWFRRDAEIIWVNRPEEIWAKI